MSHADFRPKRRAGVVPSGKPRRKIPLLRILLLIAVAIFVYVKFDDYWTAMRTTLNPAAAWDRLRGHEAEAPVAPSRSAWSPDSTRLSLECPAGLAGCCEGPGSIPAHKGLCAQAGALLSKAQWKGLISSGAAGAASSEKAALRLDARAAVSNEGFTVFKLAALRGRDANGTFFFQSESGTWCESRRGCLTTPTPRAPLSGGRLVRGPGENVGQWIAAASAVHPSLPGRVIAVDSASGGARVRVYHGRELYTSYEPVRLAPGIAAGSAVTAGTVLGTAPGGPKGFTVYMRVRRAGLNPDPFDFFALRAPSLDPAELSDVADSTATPQDTVSLN